MTDLDAAALIQRAQLLTEALEWEDEYLTKAHHEALGAAGDTIRKLLALLTARETALQQDVQSFMHEYDNCANGRTNLTARQYAEGVFKLLLQSAVARDRLDQAAHDALQAKVTALEADLASAQQELYELGNGPFADPAEHYRGMAARFAESRDELKHENRKLAAERGVLRDQVAQMEAEIALTRDTEAHWMRETAEARDQVAQLHRERCQCRFEQLDSYGGSRLVAPCGYHKDQAALVSHLRALITTWREQAEVSTNQGAARAWLKCLAEVEVLLPPGVPHQDEKG